MPSRRLAILALAAVAILTGACAPPATPTPVATPTPAATRRPPTPVARMRPSATPDPLAPVALEGIPGIVVPAGAQIVTVEEAGQETDAQAELKMADIDVEGASDWFTTEWPKRGWSAPEDLDGALQFVHETELSARHAREGLKRHALVLFSSAGDGVDIVLNVEEPD